jgi:hypothetical protein
VRLQAISADLRRRLAFWALAGVALFASHDAIYLAQLGPGQTLVAALRTAGHGYWGVASLTLAAIALVAGVRTWVWIRRLRRRADALGTRSVSVRPFSTRFAGAWWRLAAVIAIGFAVQENVEHVITHGHAIGTGALVGPEYPLALPVIGLIGAVAAAIATLVSGAHDTLIAAIEEALRRWTRAPRVGALRPARVLASPRSVLEHPGAGRAPPPLRLVSRS